MPVTIPSMSPEISPAPGLSQASRPRWQIWQLPREHGAYGQLGFPLLSAWLAGHADGKAAALTIIFLAGFWLHEPWLLWLGRRGSRARQQAGARTGWLIGALSAVALGGWVWIWFGSNAGLRMAMCLPAGLGLAVLGLAMRGYERRLWGEVLATAALVSCSMPVALAAGVPPGPALLMSLLWTCVLVSAVFAVRGLISRAKYQDPKPAMMSLLLPCGAGLAGLLATRHGMADGPFMLPLLPICILNLFLFIYPVSPRHLRKLGWAYVGVSLLTLLFMPGIYPH